MDTQKIRNDTIFFCVCIVCLISIFVSVIVNMYSISDSRNQSQEKQNSVYNVDTATLVDSGKCIVTGLWEYYDGIHLVSDAVMIHQPDSLVELPMNWSMFDRETWGRDGKASYRITLANLPSEDLVFCLYGIAPKLQIFVNGSNLDAKYYSFGRALQDVELRDMESCEIVIEVTSGWLTGIYACPWLYNASLFKFDMNMANSIWMVSLGALAVAFLLLTVILRKFRARKLYNGFMISFLAIIIFYLLATNELTTRFQYLYEYLSFEQTHLLVVSMAVMTGCVAVRLQNMLYPNVYDKKFSYFISAILYFSIFLRLIVDKYFGMDIVIGCALAIFTVYESSSTFMGLRSNGRGLVFIAAATIMINVAVSVATLTSAKHFFIGIYVILPGALLLAVLFYANFWALKFAEIQEAAANESLAKQKMMDAEIAYLTSQVQPHFQYNTLTMIQELCYTDPDKAAEAIVMFSSLLRRKVDFNKYAKLVPFSDELESIGEYMAIQKLRFKDTIIFQTDITTEDFEIPPLSIQTLVENAVHHGLRKKANGGIIQLKVDKKKNTIIIQVIDNGVGFDTVQCCTEHIGSGIENCRFRVESLMGGTVNVKSKPNIGTVVTVTIPYFKKSRMKDIK